MFVVHLPDGIYHKSHKRHLCKKCLDSGKFFLYHLTHIILYKKNELPAHDAKQLLLTINDKT